MKIHRLLLFMALFNFAIIVRAQELPPDTPADVRAIFERLKHGQPVTQQQAQRLADFLAHKRSQGGSPPPARGPAGPDLDLIQGIKVQVDVKIEGRFTIDHDGTRTMGTWNFRGAYPCRMKVSKEGGFGLPDAEKLRAMAAQMGQAIPADLPQRVPQGSSFPLPDSTASYHFVGQGGRCAYHDKRTSQGCDAPGTCSANSEWAVAGPPGGFDMTLTNFKKGDALFATGYPGGASGQPTGDASCSPKDACSDDFDGTVIPFPDEMDQLEGIVKNHAVPRPSMQFSNKAIQQALAAGQTSKVSGTENFRIQRDKNGVRTEAQGTSVVTITFKPKPIELIVTPVDFDGWLPKGMKIGAPVGNTLEIMARLQATNGQSLPAGQMAKRITFELSGVSHEPGICLNWPEAEAANNLPDLKFAARENAGGDVQVLSDTKAEKKAGDQGGRLESAVAVISCYDWGAFGKLKVTAELPDGTILEGHLQDDDQTPILLPKRKDDSSKIADAWKADHGVAGLPDNDDSENLPVGDGHKGDGLTLYEEYRGFHEGYEHICANPRRKDYFVRDTIGGRSEDGIALFAAITKLEVHHGLQPEEFAENRVINFNHGEGSHLVDQHGILLTNGGTPGGEATGGPGVPRKIICIKINHAQRVSREVKRGKSTVKTDDYVSIVAHELCHCCNIWHHGETDPGRLYFDKQNRNGRPGIAEYTLANDGHWRNGHWVEPKIEPGSRGSIDYSQFDGVKLWVAIEGGQHSGDDDCVMHYICADFYIRNAEPTVRYDSEEENAGMSLCDSNKGTGVNDAQRNPWPRQGNATKGDCQHQLCVSDAYH